jgi:hypothetical protein
MKRLEDITTSLELSKRLKESGFPQDSLFAWYWCCDYRKYFVANTKTFIGLGDKIYSAPTTDELLEQLPEFIDYSREPLDKYKYISLDIQKYSVKGDKYLISYVDDYYISKQFEIHHDKLPDALAEMWILKERGVITGE